MLAPSASSGHEIEGDRGEAEKETQTGGDDRVPSSGLDVEKLVSILEGQAAHPYLTFGLPHPVSSSSTLLNSVYMENPRVLTLLPSLGLR